MKVTERLPPVAAALSALAMLACCLPLSFAGAAGAFGFSMIFAPLQPWLMVCSVVFLAIGLIQLSRGQKSCQSRSRLSLLLFGVSAAVVLAVLVFPQQVAEAMAAFL